MDCSTPGLPVHHQLLEFTQTHVHWVGDAIQPSHPLSTLSLPAFNHSQYQSLFKWVSSSHQVARILEFQSTVTWPQLNTWGLGCSLPAGKPRRKTIWKTKGIADAVDLLIVLLFLHKAERASFLSIADKFLNKVGPTRILFLRLCCLEWPDQVGTCLQECCPLSPAQFHWVYHTWP